MACLIGNKIDVIANQQATRDVLSKFISLFTVYCEKNLFAASMRISITDLNVFISIYLPKFRGFHRSIRYICRFFHQTERLTVMV